MWNSSPEMGRMRISTVGSLTNALNVVSWSEALSQGFLMVTRLIRMMASDHTSPALVGNCTFSCRPSEEGWSKPAADVGLDVVILECQTEIGEDQFGAVIGDEDVFWLEVAVVDVFRVTVRDGVDELQKYSLDEEWVVFVALFFDNRVEQVSVRIVVHNDKNRRLEVVHFVKRQDVGVFVHFELQTDLLEDFAMRAVLLDHLETEQVGSKVAAVREGHVEDLGLHQLEQLLVAVDRLVLQDDLDGVHLPREEVACRVYHSVRSGANPLLKLVLVVKNNLG
ncbi:hypothetical protein OGATHE_001702 [Ogataea polymorpha]|uniref:Uncharacterized protein n=1 Tax=Ogataea polymorpha TaxID=460523 RepID=A0A9P8PNH3_9ASCO|nr:hypothetical protein OGATHE_001702 [Ogataea polymorpha]